MSSRFSLEQTVRATRSTEKLTKGHLYEIVDLSTAWVDGVGRRPIAKVMNDEGKEITVINPHLFLTVEFEARQPHVSEDDPRLQER
jgi:hypothetical protein